MKHIKLTAIIAVLILILSCKHQDKRNLEAQRMVMQVYNSGLFKADPERDQITQQKKDNEKKERTCNRSGGKLVQEEQSQSDYKIENNMIINVSVKQFDYTSLQLNGNV